jgi:RimJ/RimL family protein N-acetyltransferase
MMLDLQPVLSGPHLTLRPLTAQDSEALFAAASDPLVWEQHPDPARGTREGFPDYFDGALQSAGCLVAIDAATGRIVGCSRYTDYVPGKSVMVGYTFLARSHWGGPANAEMKRLMLRHAFTDVAEVQFSVAERNLRSRRAIEKLGAQLTSTGEVPRMGQIHLIYTLTPERWARNSVPGYGPV